MSSFSAFLTRFLRFSIPSLILIVFSTSTILLHAPSADSANGRFPSIVYRLWDQAEDYSHTCPQCGPVGGIKVVLWNWCDVGSGDGSNYACGAIDEYIEATKNMKVTLPDGSQIPRPFIVNIQIYSSTGEFTPNRVYQSGAKQITDCHGNRMPNYGDKIWREEYYKLARALANKYGNHPQISAFIFGVGFDDEAYPTKYCEPADPTGTYANFLRELASKLGEYFVKAGKKPVYVLAGGEGFTTDVVQSALTYGVGVKSATVAGQWNLGKVRWVGSRDASYESIVGNEALLDPDYESPWSSAIRTSDRVSWAFEDGKPFGIDKVTVAREVYLQTMMMLHFHADWFNLRNITHDYQVAAKSYPKYTQEFVPTYLGKKKANTPGVWIAFRRVLNPNICADCPYPQPMGTNVVCWVENSRDRKVCQTHVLGDLGYYLKRVADSGSKARFADYGDGRTPSDFPLPARDQIFGFGRELDSGQYMGLRIEDGVWLRSSTGNMKMRLILLNSGSSSVNVEFKKTDGTIHVETIIKGASLGTANSFVEVERVIPSVRFDGSLQGGSDVVIRASGGPTILHLLELKPTTAPPSLPSSPTPPPTPDPTPVPTPNLPPPTPPGQTPTPIPADGTVIDDKASGWTWSGWPQYDDPNCYGGTAHGGQTKGAYGQYTFSGTGVGLYAWKGPDGGQVNVILDGVSQGTYSLYHAGSEVYNAKIFEKKDLAQGSHTIRIVSQDAAWTMVDYLVIYGASTPTPAPAPAPVPVPKPPPAAGTYTIQASDGSWGSMTPTGSVVIKAGASQTFIMNPFPGYEVADVLVDGKSVGPVESYTFSNVTANHTIHAEFRQEMAITYTLAISKGGTGSGTVTANPSRTSYDPGTVVTLSATPGANSTFAGWSGACSGTSPSCQVTMKANLTVTATFNVNAPRTYTLTVSKGGSGSGTVTNRPEGSTYTAGTVVTLFAAPAGNSTFAGWSGACSGTSPSCTLTMNANKSVAAQFEAGKDPGAIASHQKGFIIDLDRNGQDDVLWFDAESRDVLAWYMKGGRYEAVAIHRDVADSNWRMVGGGNLREDGSYQIFWHNAATGQVYAWFMKGTTYLREHYINTVEDVRWKLVGVGDFDRDGNADLLWHHQKLGLVYIWFMNGVSFIRDQYVATIDDLRWQVVGVGDLNEDRRAEILWQHSGNGALYIWYMDGARWLRDQFILNVEDLNWKVMGIGRFSGNRTPNILWRHEVSGEVYIWHLDRGRFLRDSRLQPQDGN